MRVFFRLLILTGILAGLGASAHWAYRYWQQRNRPTFRTAKVTEGSITAVVNSTGEVKPVLSIAVGSFVSGPVEALYVDFNEEVKKGQLLAEIDPRIYKAAVASDQAALAIRRGEVGRVESDLGLARADEQRAESLQTQGEGYISQVEADQYRFARQSLEAQLVIAKAGVVQAEAALETSRANLAYTRIESPVDGIIIDRKIEPGQTLAAQFQTPELFTVAPDIHREMHVFASVDEADIGLIRDAQDEGKPVDFTVDAYPQDAFEGSIKQIRLSPIINQNVVTYPVVVSASNPAGKLMPGMTASLSFQIDHRQECTRVPNAALRYFPDVELVHPDDKKIVTGINDSEEMELVDDESVEEKTGLASRKNDRYVWVWKDPFLRAVAVTIGIRDSQWTELVDGSLRVGDSLVTAIQE
jgi:HlyD family secretion protein